MSLRYAALFLWNFLPKNVKFETNFLQFKYMRASLKGKEYGCSVCSIYYFYVKCVHVHVYVCLVHICRSNVTLFFHLTYVSCMYLCILSYSCDCSCNIVISFYVYSDAC